MITAVTPGQGAAQFRAALAGVPALGPQLGAAFALYGEKPASGWAFYLAGGCPLAVKGRAAWLAVPHDSEAPEGDELASFLGFVGAASLHSNGPGPAGWKKSVLARMAPGPDLAERPAPEDFRLDKAPSMGEVADLIMAPGRLGGLLRRMLHPPQPRPGPYVGGPGGRGQTGFHGERLGRLAGPGLHGHGPDRSGMPWKRSGGMAYPRHGPAAFGGRPDGGIPLPAGPGALLYPPWDETNRKLF